MKLEYKVKLLQGNTYYVTDYGTGANWFQGTLTDCEAWIRLEVGGYF